jgi:hypothetical protein
VDEKNQCKVCNKVVMIMHLWLYRPFTQCCCVKKMENEFKFCELCRGVCHNPDGSRPSEVAIVVDRAAYMLNKDLVRRHGQGFFL